VPSPRPCTSGRAPSPGAGPSSTGGASRAAQTRTESFATRGESRAGAGRHGAPLTRLASRPRSRARAGCSGRPAPEPVRRRGPLVLLREVHGSSVLGSSLPTRIGPRLLNRRPLQPWQLTLRLLLRWLVAHPRQPARVVDDGPTQLAFGHIVRRRECLGNLAPRLRCVASCQRQLGVGDSAADAPAPIVVSLALPEPLVAVSAALQSPVRQPRGADADPRLTGINTAEPIPGEATLEPRP